MNASRAVFLTVMGLLLGGCATRPVNPPITQTDPRTGYRFETRQAVSANSKDNLVILAFSGGGTRAAAFSYGVLEFLRRTEIVGRERRQGSPARLHRRHHRRVGRQLHGAGVRPLRRQAVRRLRAALPEAQRPGRARLPRLQPALLGRPLVGWLGPVRAGVAAVRRDPVQRRHLRRSQPRQGPDDPGVRHRHLDRLALRLPPGHVRHHLLGPQRGAAFPRRRGLVGRAGGALVRSRSRTTAAPATGRRPPWTKPFLDNDNPPRPAARAIRSLKNLQAYGDGATGPISISSTAASRTTWACAACSMRWKSSKRCTRPACRRRSTARSGSSSSS